MNLSQEPMNHDFHKNMLLDLGNPIDSLSRIRMGYVPPLIPDRIPSIKPDISSFSLPLYQPQLPLRYDVKHETKEYIETPPTNGKKARKSKAKHPIRLVTKVEAAHAADLYRRRKSLPLEKCPICKKYFRRMKTHLTKHEPVNLLAHGPLTCTFCSKNFNMKSNLLIHLRTHTGDKPYVCEVCQKGFAQSCNLVNHVRTHTGERPFKCPHCDRAFAQSGNLNNHVRLHTEDKPFKCHFCDKAFVQSGNLSSHLKNNHKSLDQIDDNHTIGHKNTS